MDSLPKIFLPIFLVGATPKGVLRVMGVPGLTIYHVKSHLQVHPFSEFIGYVAIFNGW